MVLDKTKRIVVAGGAGLVGQSLVKKLVDTGWMNIVATYHKKKPDFEHENVKWVKGNLTNRKFCDYITMGCEYLVHIAAFSQGAKTMQENPVSLVTQNILMYVHLMEAAYNAQVKKVIALGSSTAYPPMDRPVVETDMFTAEPWDKYYGVGWTKIYLESLLKFYSTKVPNPIVCVSLRPANIYGPNDKFDPNRCHVLPATIRKVLENDEEITVWSDGKELRDLIYVDDVSEAILLALHKCESYDVFNIAAGDVVSVNEIIALVKDLCGKNHLRIKYDMSKPSMIKVREINVNKAKEVLGFEATTPLRDGLMKTIDWYQNEYKGK